MATKTRKPTFWISLLLLSSLFVSCTGSTECEYLTVDQLKYDLIQLARSSEEYASKGLKIKHLIRGHKVFGDKVEKQFSMNHQQLSKALGLLSISESTRSEFRRIEDYYTKFQTMQRSSVAESPTSHEHWRRFAENVLRHFYVSILTLPVRATNTTTVHDLFTSANKEASAFTCYKRQMAQYYLSDLHTAIALTELKGHTMIQFSYQFLRLYYERQQYAEITDKIDETVMTSGTRELWMRDPAEHILGETYVELEQVFQGFVISEVNLNWKKKCGHGCSHYTNTSVYGCYEGGLCNMQRECKGRVYNCNYFSTDMWICPSDKNDTRRYTEVVKNSESEPPNLCPMTWKRLKTWMTAVVGPCTYCFCYCDERTDRSERHFSLRPVTSDIANNKVITGIRFVKDRNIIHLQILEGELLPFGLTDVWMATWKDIDYFSTSDSNVKDKVDYHTITWKKRAVDLDDIVVPNGYILTGVRFRAVQDRLSLEIRISKFDFTTGNIVDPDVKNNWISNDVTDREELKLENRNIPTESELPALPDAKGYQYVTFAASDRESDAAQSTVPFIDVQEVAPSPPVPLRGVGIYHKGNKDSAGFLALKVFAYDFGSH